MQLFQRLTVAAPISRHFHRSEAEATAVRQEYQLQPSDVLIIQHPAPRSIESYVRNRPPLRDIPPEPEPEPPSRPVMQPTVSLRATLDGIPHSSG